MFGSSPFASWPYAGLQDIRVFLTGGARVDVDFRYRITAATREFISRGTDDPPNTPFLGTLKQALRFDRSVVSGARLGELTSGHGTLTMTNIDGQYDGLIRFYGVDGRRVVVKVGRGHRHSVAPYAGFATIFDGTAVDLDVQEDLITVDLRDNGYRLEVPLQPNTYPGAGGADGGDDLAGKTRPRAFGFCQNVTAPLVQASALLYQVNDGAVQAIPAVYVKGAALTPGADYASVTALLAAVIPAGQFATCIASGFFRINFLLEGAVTADVQGDNAGGYAVTAIDIVRRIVRSAGLVDPDDLYTPSFPVALAAQSAPIGYFAASGDSQSVATAVQRIMGSVGGWGGFRRNGKFEVVILLSPSGAPNAVFDEADVIGGVQREKLPAALSPMPYRIKVGWGRNWTPQTELAGSVAAARVAFLAESVRYATAESATIKADHPLAQEYEPAESYFVNQADAQAEAARLLALYRRSRSLYSVNLGAAPWALNLGEVIRLTYPRFDLVAGRLLRIVTLSEDSESETVTLVGYG